MEVTVSYGWCLYFGIIKKSQCGAAPLAAGSDVGTRGLAIDGGSDGVVAVKEESEPLPKGHAKLGRPE